eukprot:3933720-Rhodomonas_salina.1
MVTLAGTHVELWGQVLQGDAVLMGLSSGRVVGCVKHTAMGCRRGGVLLCLLLVCTVEESVAPSCNCNTATCSGNRFVSICNNSRGKQCTNCRTCQSWQYASGCGGCGSNGSPGTCVNCASCPTGQQRVNCGGKSSGSCQVVLLGGTGLDVAGQMLAAAVYALV